MKYQKNITKAKETGITLVTLVLTIIILLILAGVTIGAITSNTGLLSKTQQAKKMYENSALNEAEQFNKLYEQLSGSEGGETASTSDGSWNSIKKVNSPKIEGTGLIPVTLADDGTETIVTDLSSDWYDYDNQKWANAVTKDNNGNITGYFVWIPRFSYRITSGCNTSTVGTIKVKFLQGTSDQDENGTTIKETYPTVTSGAMADYVVHPAFTTNGANGGWDKNIEGFWVAKYPAGYQKSTLTETGTTVSTTLVNSEDTLVESNKNYTVIDNDYTSNAVNSLLSTSTKMSYPVFKPLTYAYNCTTIGEMYTLSREIQNATNFYGLTNIDSHMQKNSECGAVAYLTQSSYGRNGTEVNINNFNYNNNNSKNTYAITGLYGAGDSNAPETSINSVNAYNSAIGLKGSSTGNITGVYDLNGCIWEYKASYITNGTTETYGSSFAYTTADVTPQVNNRSTRWATAYSYDSSSDSNTSNWAKYNSLRSSAYGFGDAILETSTAGSDYTSWNGDYSHFPFSTGPFFIRGGNYSAEVSAGIFSFASTFGSRDPNSGFRLVLVA